MIDRHWSVPDPLRERVLEQLVTDLRHEVELRSQQDRPTWRRLLSRILGDLPDRSKHRKRLVA